MTPGLHDLTGELRAEGLELDASGLSRMLYSNDASLYRIEPRAVVFPRDADDIVATLDVCRRLGVPLTTRGAGTSIAGNAIGTGVILDTSRHMNRIVSLDAETRTAVVQPGVVQANLSAAGAPNRLRFGPDPSTSNRCTIGGMIGNNACGSRALMYGRTSDNVVALDFLAGNGERMQLNTEHSPTLDALSGVIAPHHDLIRRQFGTFPRQVSGYALENLLPENNDVLRLVTGSEGTLGVVLQATMRMVSDPPFRTLVVLGYSSMPDAADDVMAVLAHGPTACEGLDARIVDAIRSKLGPARVPALPEGKGWLFVELPGDTSDEVASRARALVGATHGLESIIVTDPADALALWKIREDGAGLSSRTPDGRPTYAGWEDAAVPPESLGSYLRDFDALMGRHDITGMPYGHFGDGCVHVRLDFPLTSPGGTDKMRAFLTEAAHLVVGYGGSLSGEHGDGRARSEFLSMMYDDEALALFGEVKATFDPDGVMNPGVIVRPDALDANLRAPQSTRFDRVALRLAHDEGDLAKAVHRCTGVGKCIADTTGSGGVMCPSYVATRDEKDSTRGRARVLQQVIDAPGEKDWRSKELHEALDLCLMCKGCSSDCPTGVDMASYKAEVLHQSYRRRLRPRSHYSLGWLPRWSALAARAPRIANAVLEAPGVARVAKLGAGVDRRRNLPKFATQTFRQWFAAHDSPAGAKPVALMIDTFTNYFSPRVGIAAVRVLEDAGYVVEITDRQVCCGLTWISTGQLDAARRKIGNTLEALQPFADRGVSIIGLEPSCTAVLRSDATELVEGAEPVARMTRTLAEFLREDDTWQLPDLSGVEAVAQPHCHQHSVMGWDVDADLLEAAGADVQRVGGCCGLAGNFGVERGHYETSVAVAEHDLLPAVRKAGDALVLADGFSCRTQLDDLANRESIHLAELLAQDR